MNKGEKPILKRKADGNEMIEKSKKIGKKADSNAEKLKASLKSVINNGQKSVDPTTVATNGDGLKGTKESKKKKTNKGKSMEEGNMKAGIDNGQKEESATKGKKMKQGNPANAEQSKAHKPETPTELTAKQLAKIEKKKAKKLAQKLRKQQKKKAEKTEATHREDVQRNEPDNKVEKADKKKEKQKKMDKNKKHKITTKEKERKEHDPALVAATVFVGNLPVNTKRAQIIRHFEAYGPVNSVRFRTASGKLIFKHKQRLEAGSLNAYVVLKNAEAAEQALALNGSVFKGNHLRVTKADVKVQAVSNADTKRTIFVGNLKYSANEEKLREIFSSCGEIEYVRCLRDGEKGCKGVAYVCFKAPEAVGLAMELNETILDERPIHVERYSVKKQGAKQARDEAVMVEQKSKTGAKQRIDAKNKKGGKGKQQPPATEVGKGKKLKFHGVKVDAMKKNLKKKKITSKMQALAKKIAPKTFTN